MITRELILTLKNLKGVGNKTIFQLFTELQSYNLIDIKDYFDAILEISKNKNNLRLSNIEMEQLIISNSIANKIIEDSEKHEIKIVGYYDDDFPESLKKIDNSPLLINVKGNYKALVDLVGVAIIGTRDPSENGFKTGKYIGKEIGAKGFNVVSGLAKGCDASAHEGCLSVGGTTTAVLAHGLDHIYPKENKQLAIDIIENNGCLISEYTIGTRPFSSYFIERDRIQSALSLATIVIQTDTKGGTMHAVNDTLKYKKILGAISYVGKELSYPKTKGNQMLISEQKAIPISKESLTEFLLKIPIPQTNITNKIVKTRIKTNVRGIVRTKIKSNKIISKKTIIKNNNNQTQLKLDFNND